MTAARVRLARGAAGWFAAAVAALTAGCGNFYEKASERGWHAVGLNEPPASQHAGAFEVTTLRPGSGSIVRAGDLVHVRLLVTTPRSNASSPKPWPVDAWLWTGREPETSRDVSTLVAFGDLGSARVRAALVGRAVGERFAIRLPDDAEPSNDSVPLYAVWMPDDSAPAAAALWPTVDLAGVGRARTSAEVEIVDACAARLMRREVTLRQWGYVLNLFEMDYGPRRRGVLGFTAIESDCVAFGRPIRFEVGPMYYRPGGPPRDTQLNDWTTSLKVASALQWGFVDWRYVVAALMAWAGYAVGRRRNLN